MDILGAISGSRLRRERYDKEIQRERDNAVFAAAIDPNSAMTPEARERVFADYGKSYVDPKDPQSQYHYDRVVSAARAARMHREKPAPPPSAVNPAAMAPNAAPTPSGGLTNPDTSGFSYALLRPPAQPQSNILFSSPFAAQKKTSNADQPIDQPSAPTPISQAAPGVTLRDATTPDWTNPSPTSTVASPGMNSIAPTNTPSPTGPLPAPFRWTRTDAEMGAAKAAREIPLKRGEYEAMYGAQYDLYNKKFKEITKWIDERNKQEPDSDIEYTMEMSANGMPILKMDRGANVGQPVTGNLVPANAKIVGGGARDETMTYQLRTYGNGSVKAFPISPILRQGFTTDDAGNPVPVQANPRLVGSTAAAGFKPLTTFNPRLFNTGTGVTIASPNQIAASGLPAPIPGTIGTGAPITRTNTRDQLVDLGNVKKVIPMSTTATSQRGTSPLPAPTATGGQPLPVTPSRGGGSSTGRTFAKGLNPNQVMGMQNAITMGTHQLFGDPDDPTLKPLASYSRLADDPGANQRLGKAFNLLLHSGNFAGAANVGADLGPVSMSTGAIGSWLQNSLGITGADAAARAATIHDAIADLKPEEIEYLNKMMAAIPTITGYRKLTSGGAFRWSQDALERELPFIGLGTTDSRSYNQKMQNLGNEPLTAIRNLERTNPGAIDPRLSEMIRGVKSLSAPSITPPGVEPIKLKDGRTLMPHDKKAADAFRKEHPELIAK